MFCCDLEQVPEQGLLGVVGAGGVARRGADADVLLGDEVGVLQVLVGRVAPEVVPDPLVHPLGERLGEPVGQRLEQDRVVVVHRGLELVDLVVRAEPGRDRERADVVGPAAVLGRHEVGHGPVGDALAVLALLAQRVQRRRHGLAGLVGVDLDVVADRVGREQAEDAVGAQPLLLDELVEHPLRVLVELGRGLTGRRVVEDVGEAALHLPGEEERTPVDVVAQLGDRVVVEGPHELGDGAVAAAAGLATQQLLLLGGHEVRHRRPVAAPVDRRGRARGPARSTAAGARSSWPRAAPAASRSRP